MTPERIEFVLRDGPVVVFVLEKSGNDWRPTYISDNAQQFTGFEPSALLGDTWLKQTHPEDLVKLRGSQFPPVTDKFEDEFRFYRADGQLVWVRIEARIFFDVQGNPLEIVGYATDISHIKKLTDQLSHELSRTQAILSAIPDALFEIDPQGRFLFFRVPKDKQYIATDHPLGTPISDLFPEDVAKLGFNAISRALLTGTTQTIKYSLPEGKKKRFFQASIGPSPSGTVVAIVRDISEEVEHEKALTHKTRILEEANTSLEQFVYVASHDLREPLTGIAGYATLVQKRYADKLDGQGRHFLDETIKATKRMETKIDDLLALSRAGRGTPLTSTFPLGAAMEEAKRSLIGVVRKSGAIFHIPDNLPVVKGDRSQIAQVFQNLFSNSIKYGPKDVPPIIEVSTECSDTGEWIISVQDNGIGFDMKHVDRIFGVFQRLYTVEQYPGTGIGLAIVKKIVERHEGRVWALSEPGKGATFHFTLRAPCT